jgi:hypothetical protein
MFVKFGPLMYLARWCSLYVTGLHGGHLPAEGRLGGEDGRDLGERLGPRERHVQIQ